MINRVIVTGRLTRTPELKQSKNDMPYSFFTVAVNSKFKDKESVDFINCIAWNKTAEILCKYTEKGALILVEGKLKSRMDNDKKSILEVVADVVQFFDGKKQGTELKDDDLPF